MTGDLWQKGPLGEEIEKHHGRPTPGVGWARGLANWKAVCLEISLPTSNFYSTLSVSQQNSLHLLLDWWQARYEDKTLINKVIGALERHARSEVSGARYPKALGLDVSQYVTKLFDLLLYEFYFYGKTITAPFQLRRHNAAVIAACQRLAFRPDLIHDTPRSPLGPTGVDSTKSTSSSIESPFQHVHVGAIVEACPWLPSIQKRGAPHFLWDIDRQETVTTSDMEYVPPYCIVSHTWGRWRLASELSVPGVPWKVPANSRFDVRRLPEVLSTNREIFYPATHVWFDLLCIPQDGSALADVEIARQAAIFGNALNAMIWLNDISGWRGLQAALQWLALRYLSISCPTVYTLHEEFAKATHEAEKTTQLFGSFSITETDVHIGSDPAGWFTSLWTLQEAFLRPEMTLHDQNWKTLELGSGAGTQPVTLDSLLALCSFEKYEIADMPAAVVELFALIDHTRLDYLLEYSPLTALTLASRRQCSEGRAEAIMSVFGAISWFKGTTKRDRETNLILDSYPLEFLQEVLDILGTNFFCSYYLECCFWDIFQLSEEGEAEAIPVGTLLPFDN
jgi:hypothetical protein